MNVMNLAHTACIAVQGCIRSTQPELVSLGMGSFSRATLRWPRSAQTLQTLAGLHRTAADLETVRSCNRLPTSAGSEILKEYPAGSSHPAPANWAGVVRAPQPPRLQHTDMLIPSYHIHKPSRPPTLCLRSGGCAILRRSMPPRTAGVFRIVALLVDARLMLTLHARGF
jgi:hypothetical protein